MELPAGTKRTFDRGHEWLTSGPEKMIVAHCFTGYLRSIVFAACFLSWQGLHGFCLGHVEEEGHAGHTGGTISDFKMYKSSSPGGIIEESIPSLLGLS